LRRNFGSTSDLSNSSTGDFQVGDIITTEEQEKTVNHFNSTPKDGWYVSNIETNNEKGSLPEFIEKEGKWFNYIKGVDQTIVNEQLQDYSGLDFGSFEIQGLGIVGEINNNDITISGNLNNSLQVGDVLYFEKPLGTLGPELVSNGRFDTTDDWVFNIGDGTPATVVEWSISGGQAHKNPGEHGYIQQQNILLEANQTL